MPWRSTNSRPGIGSRGWEPCSAHGLASVDGVLVHDKGEVHGGIVTFTVDGWDAADAVRVRRRRQAVNTSASPAEYAQYDLPHRGLPALVRASVHYYNTEDEIDALVAALA